MKVTCTTAARVRLARAGRVISSRVRRPRGGRVVASFTVRRGRYVVTFGRLAVRVRA